MPVISSLVQSRPTDRHLAALLLACQERASHTGTRQWLSISQAMRPVEPLAILQAKLRADERHFYWEHRASKRAIAALGTAAVLATNAPGRFTRARAFVRDCLQRYWQAGESDLPGSGAHFFGYFTFFDAPSPESSFPAATLFLPRLQVTRLEDRAVLTVNFIIDRRTKLDAIRATWQHHLDAIEGIPETAIALAMSGAKRFTCLPSNAEDSFRASVGSALQAIEQGEYAKIVLARTLDVRSPLPFDIVASLNSLRQRHPNCYVFSASNGKGNTFIGASPERLASVENAGLVTDALAGSAPRGATAAEDAALAEQLAANPKERSEHTAVRDFLIQRLQAIGLRPQASPLQLLQLANIQHLWTPIRASLPETAHPLEIISHLHPTPAVAGVPTPIACDRLRQFETSPRSLYAAPIGWVNARGDGEFVVGIRSAEIAGNCARLYAGAGIVSGSDRDRESAEVQLKLQAMLQALV